MLGRGSYLVRAVRFRRFDLFGIGGLLAYGFIFGRILEFFDRLAEAFGEGRKFGAAEEHQQNDERKNQDTSTAVCRMFVIRIPKPPPQYQRELNQITVLKTIKSSYFR